MAPANDAEDPSGELEYSVWRAEVPIVTFDDAVSDILTSREKG